jgi:hypothetical protein
MRLLYCALIGIPSCVLAAEPTAEELAQKKVELMTSTKIAAVTELSVPASEYKSDGDPETLEIVFLSRKKDGPNRVSEDGEVIFLYKASGKKQQALIDLAFEIRARRALSEH